MIKELLNWLFPHRWEYSEDNQFRTCAICGRLDELDHGSGMAGSMWLNVTAGRKEAHASQSANAGKPTQLAAPGPSPSAMSRPPEPQPTSASDAMPAHR